MDSISPRVVTELPFLLSLAEGTEKQATALLNKATTDNLWALRDAAKEVLDFKIHLTVLQREALQPYIDSIRALGYATSLPSVVEALRIYFRSRVLLLQGVVIPVIEHIEGSSEQQD